MFHEFKMFLKQQNLDKIVNNYRKWKNLNDKNSFFLNFLFQSMFMNIYITKFNNKLQTMMNKISNRLNIITLNSYFWIQFKFNKIKKVYLSNQFFNRIRYCQKIWFCKVCNYCFLFRNFSINHVVKKTKTTILWIITNIFIVVVRNIWKI